MVRRGGESNIHKGERGMTEEKREENRLQPPDFTVAVCDLHTAQHSRGQIVKSLQ